MILRMCSGAQPTVSRASVNAAMLSGLLTPVSISAHSSPARILAPQGPLHSAPPGADRSVLDVRRDINHSNSPDAFNRDRGPAHREAHRVLDAVRGRSGQIDRLLDHDLLPPVSPPLTLPTPGR